MLAGLALAVIGWPFKRSFVALISKMRDFDFVRLGAFTLFLKCVCVQRSRVFIPTNPELKPNPA
jgi:hypothetical protein